MRIKIKNPYELDEMHQPTIKKRPNKGIQKYGKYKLMADLEFAKHEALIHYNNRVKNQK